MKGRGWVRLLIITHDYPPIATPRAYRWEALAGQLARGHAVDVICAWGPGAARVERRNGVRIHRVGGMLLGRLRHGFHDEPPASATAAGDDTSPAVRRARRIRRACLSLVRRGWRSLYWPDAACGFIRPAFRAARRLLHDDCDALITVSHPFSCHIVGLWLKRRPRHAGLRWVADVGDPFALVPTVNNQRLYARRNVRVEADVLAAADCVAVTNRVLRDVYIERFGAPPERITVIPPLLSLEDLAPEPADARRTEFHSVRAWGCRIRRDGSPGVGAAAGRSGTPSYGSTLGGRSGTPSYEPLRLVYCGQLYRDLRSPEPLLQLVRAVADDSRLGRPVELHLYGRAGDCGEVLGRFHDLIGRTVFVHGHVPRSAALAAQRRADVLVNIGNATTHQVPSKVIEAIGLRKPILNLVSHPRDLSLELLAAHPATLTLVCGGGGGDNGDTPARIAENAAKLIAFVHRLPAEISDAEHRRLCAPFLPEAIAAAYLRLAGGPAEPRDPGASARAAAIPSRSPIAMRATGQASHHSSLTRRVAVDTAESLPTPGRDPSR